MELTHKLTRTTRVWGHDAPASEWKSARYAQGQDEQNLYLGEDDYYEILRASGEDITTQPVYLTQGDWRLDAPNYSDLIAVHRIDTGHYEVGSHVTLKGEKHHGDIISITSPSQEGFYIVETETALSSFAFVPQQEALTPHDTHDTVTIEEPIGFDKLQMEMQRHDYHGIGAEVSVGTLEFYGLAADIIEQQRDSDIDLDVTYEVTTASGDVVYSGKVDLTTASVKIGDYKSVSAKVGEIGAKTTFNNRIDTSIDIDAQKTVDGVEMSSPVWRNVHIPLKHLPYTDVAKQKADNRISVSGNSSSGVLLDTSKPCIFLPIGESSTVEFATFNAQVDPPYSVATNELEYVDPQYVTDEDFATQFGTGVYADVDIDIKFVIHYRTNSEIHTYYNRPEWARDRYRIVAKMLYNPEGGDTQEDTIVGNWCELRPYDRTLYQDDGDEAYQWKDVECNPKLRGRLLANGSIKYYIELVTDGGARNVAKPITVVNGSYVRLTIYDNLTDSAPVYADTLLAHDALNMVAQAISEKELSVKSDWYRTPESMLNGGSIGGGSCKAITTGYKIRGISDKNVAVSFKSLIESLSALDCIGWGFSLENGALCVRVERWSWFYQNTILVDLADVAEVTTEVYTDRIPTELAIGYKKYATSDQYNSIDSPHGTRTFANGIKSVSKTITKQCDFVADNYAIEETRRAKIQKSETEETTYDGEIFVFELIRNNNGVYLIGHTAKNAVNVGRVEEFINAKLTPRHMAARWRDFLFPTTNQSYFRFMSGELNCASKFECSTALHTEGGVIYASLKRDAVNNPQAENDDISYVSAIYKAEKITFSYPITLAQYNAIKANPYGLIGVNGKRGWIMDFKYTFATGMADFTLIAKR